jgi:hypothetical protein
MSCKNIHVTTLSGGILQRGDVIKYHHPEILGDVVGCVDEIQYCFVVGEENTSAIEVVSVLITSHQHDHFIMDRDALIKNRVKVDRHGDGLYVYAPLSDAIRVVSW